MQFTLINDKGRVRKFFIREVAELYRTIEGGVIEELAPQASNTAKSP